MGKGRPAFGHLGLVKYAISPAFFSSAVFEGEIEEHFYLFIWQPYFPSILSSRQEKGGEFSAVGSFSYLGPLLCTSSFPDFPLRLAILFGKVGEVQSLLYLIQYFIFQGGGSPAYIPLSS